MADMSKIRRESRQRRKKGKQKRILGTSDKPRLCVFRSLKYSYVQLISDADGSVLGAASTREVVGENSSPKCVESAKALGKRIAEIAKEQKIESVVFDRNGYMYHGRIAAIAEGARENGLKF